MTKPFYRTWLPVSLVLHVVLIFLLNIVPLGVPHLGDRMVPVSIVEAAELPAGSGRVEPTPPPPPPPPPVKPAVKPPVVKSASSSVERVANVVNKHVPLGGHQQANPTITTGTARLPGSGEKVNQPGVGVGRTKAPALMTSPTGTEPGVPKGDPNGVGTGGPGDGPSGPSYGARAKYGRTGGPDKLAGEINRAGEAVYDVLVNARGDVVDVILVKSTGSEDLDQIALRRVRSYAYEAGMKNGQAITDTVRMRVEFHNGQYSIEEVK